jgi:hypothetical protein
MFAFTTVVLFLAPVLKTARILTISWSATAADAGTAAAAAAVSAAADAMERIATQVSPESGKGGGRY